MKKFILMLSLIAFSFQMGNAQTDLQITGIMPVANGVYDSIANGELVTFSVAIKNNGPSNLGFTDTVVVYMELDWLIGFPGYIFRGTYPANSLNSMFSGSSDTVYFSFNQNVSLGQTPDGNAIPTVPNHQYLNDIVFKVYGYTASMNLLNDVGSTVDNNGDLILSGNNLFNPVNVIFGMQDTPVLAISADANSVCEGTAVTFTANVTDPGSSPTYQWKVNNMNVGTNSPTFTSSNLADNDEVTCTYISMVNGISMDVVSSSIIMTVTPAVVPTVSLTVSPGTSVPTGTTVLFTTTITNGGLTPVYTWYRNQNIISGESSFTYSAVAGTDFIDGDQIYVSMTSSESCVNPLVVNSTPMTMDVPVGIESLNAAKGSLLTVSPNPNKGEFLISANDLMKGTYTIKAVNALGQIVLDKTITVQNSLQERISISELSSGTYYLILSNENGKVASSKIVIQK